MKRLVLMSLLVTCFATTSQGRELTVSRTSFLLDGKPFPFNGVSFFNAIYNPSFNESSAKRTDWLRRFQDHGINVLRVWAQWDRANSFADACETCTLYQPSGELRQEHMARLKEIISDADNLGMVIELVLFSRGNWDANIRLGQEEADLAVASLARELLPHRNVVFQIWNEFSHRVFDHLKTIKTVDNRRLVTNSPGSRGGSAGDLGDRKHNEALDFLTPHTSRQGDGNTLEIVPKEIAYLLARYSKPVVDDEPARNGTSRFSGPPGPTSPYDHILQIYQVWREGGYTIYHHDMFQTGYGTPSVPPSGVPDPEFSPYHRQVFAFLAQRDRYMPARTQENQ